jgi:hypothetical protein
MQVRSQLAWGHVRAIESKTNECPVSNKILHPEQLSLAELVYLLMKNLLGLQRLLRDEDSSSM